MEGDWKEWRGRGNCGQDVMDEKRIIIFKPFKKEVEHLIYYLGGVGQSQQSATSDKSAKRTRDTSDTAALGLIATGHREESGPQKPQLCFNTLALSLD